MNPWIFAGLLAAGFAGGWGVNGWRLESAYQTEENARLGAAIAERDAMREDRDKLAVKLATNNDTHLAQLRKAQNENITLRNRVDAGTVRLRVAATCPQPVQTGESSGATVDPGTGPELDATARPTYHALRDGIKLVTAQLEACQGELRLRVQNQH